MIKTSNHCIGLTQKKLFFYFLKVRVCPIFLRVKIKYKVILKRVIWINYNIVIKIFVMTKVYVIELF